MKLWYRELFLLFIPFTLALIGLLIQDRFFKKTELQINKDIEFFLTRCLASIIIA